MWWGLLRSFFDLDNFSAYRLTGGYPVKSKRMKKRTLGLLIGIAGLLISCSTEVSLEGPWADIPVVYGLLAKNDSAQYIRVEKAFQTSGEEADAVAQRVDSVYYQGIKVYLERVATGQKFLLQRVDANAEGYPRVPGPFTGLPNYVYKISKRSLELKGEERIRLWLERPAAGQEMLAETVVLSDLVPRETSPANPVNMGYDRQVAVSWNTTATAALFELRLVVRYLEKPAGATAFGAKSLVWVLVRNLERSDNTGRMTYSFNGSAFYKYLGERIPSVQGTVRILEGLDLEIYAGGQEFADQWKQGNANVGITSAQWISTYSNISGGRGLFSSRSEVVRPGLQLSASSLDSLRNGIYTRDLNFQ